MGTLIEQVAAFLSDAELRVRDWIAEAATSGDYEAARRLASAAERLARLHNEYAGFPGEAPQVIGGIENTAKLKTSRCKSSRRRKAGYPRFERHNNVIRKIGWSKKTQREYEQKATRDAYDRTVEALATLTRNGGGVITVEQMVEHLEGLGGSELPVYQVYIVLALLKREGLVEKCGREGYRVHDASQLVVRSRVAWDNVDGAR